MGTALCSSVIYLSTACSTPTIVLRHTLLAFDELRYSLPRNSTKKQPKSVDLRLYVSAGGMAALPWRLVQASLASLPRLPSLIQDNPVMDNARPLASGNAASNERDSTSTRSNTPSINPLLTLHVEPVTTEPPGPQLGRASQIRTCSSSWMLAWTIKSWVQ